MVASNQSKKTKKVSKDNTMSFSQMKKPIVLIVTALVVVAVFFAGFAARPVYEKRQFENSTKTAQDFVKLIVEGKNDQAYALTTKTLQSQQDKAAFAAALGDLKSDKPDIQKSQAVNNDGTIIYYQRVLNLPKSTKGSTTGLFYVTSVKEDGKWKIASVTVQ
jgi:hypothetical protein